MSCQKPYCQMCKKELCVVCKQQLDNCKCPCPNFVICRYCEAHEKAIPPCEDNFPPACSPVFGGNSGGGGALGGGFSGGGPLSKMVPLFMMMMMNANKQGGGKNCDCSRRSHNRKRDRDCSPRRDNQPPPCGCACCCKTNHTKPIPSRSQPDVILNPCPPNPCPPDLCVPNSLPPNPCLPKPSPLDPYLPNTCASNCCTCSSRGGVHNGNYRDGINQYFFGSDCSPQLTAQRTSYSSHPQAKDDHWARDQHSEPQKTNLPDIERRPQQDGFPAPVRPTNDGGWKSQQIGSLPQRPSDRGSLNQSKLMKYGPSKRGSLRNTVTMNKV